MDHIVAGAEGKAVGHGTAGHDQIRGQCGSVDIFKIGDQAGIAGCLVSAGCHREVDRRDATRDTQHERIGSCTGCDRNLGPGRTHRIIA